MCDDHVGEARATSYISGDLLLPILSSWMGGGSMISDLIFPYLTSARDSIISAHCLSTIILPTTEFNVYGYQSEYIFPNHKLYTKERWEMKCHDGDRELGHNVM